MHVRISDRRNVETRAPLVRGGFTLVELLVAVAIFVLLTAIVLAAFQRNNADRLSASGRMLQSYFEGARSRAINDGQIRGVRLIRSANDTATVDTLAYVGSPGFLAGECSVLWEDNIKRWYVKEAASTVWNRLVPAVIKTSGPDWTLNSQGRGMLIQNGRIEIPARSGQWYAFTIGEDLNRDGVLQPAEDFLDSTDGMLSYRDSSGQVGLVLSSHYLESKPKGNTEWEPTSDGNIPYRLELAPTLLPNTEPITLETGIVIDLDASQLPGQWRPSPADDPYAESFDVLFDSRGSPTGSIVASGLVHFYLTTLSDVELTRGDPDHPRNGTGSAPFKPWPYIPARAPTVPATEPIVLNLFTQGGQVTTSSVDFTDVETKSVPPALPTPGSDGFADRPYSYARRGQEAQ